MLFTPDTVISCYAAPLLGPEMVLNAGFEEWSSGSATSWDWAQGSGNTSEIVWEKETTLAHEGNCSFKVTLLTQSAHTLEQVILGVYPDVQYAMSFWEYDNSPGQITWGVHALADNGTKLHEVSSWSSGAVNEWKEGLGGAITYPFPETAKVRVYVTFESFSALDTTLYVDDASFKDNTISEIDPVIGLLIIPATILAIMVVQRIRRKE